MAYEKVDPLREDLTNSNNVSSFSKKNRARKKEIFFSFM